MFVIEYDRKQYSEKITSAIRRNDRETILTLLKGCNPAKIKDHENSTLLHLAIKISNFQIINFLINIGCDINAQDRTGKTPLLAALEVPHFPIMIKLLKAKANIFISDNKGINILNKILKLKRGRKVLIKIIIKRIQECGFNAKELASIIMEAGWPIHYAIHIKNSEVIKFMLDAGCDVNAPDEYYLTTLHRAIIVDDIETIKILLEYGADIDIIHIMKGSPFELAIEHTDVFKTFLKHQPILERFSTDGAIRSYEPFVYANSSVIRLLSDFKVSLTTKDRFGDTLLYHLVRNFKGSREVINLITKSEIDVNIENNHGNTPLHNAVGFSRIEYIKALINKGADVNAKNKFDHTPLFIAIFRYAKEEEIDILVENGKIMDDEIQNNLIIAIVTTNIPLLNVSSILKRLAISHFQLALSRKNFELIQNNSNINLLFESYLRELDSMKQNQIIDSSNISVFDILCASEQKLVNLARNNEMVVKFYEIDFGSKYRIFGELVRKRFESAHSKQNLIQNAIDVITENIKQLNSNLEVTENIVECLSTDDLVTLHLKGHC